MSCCGGQSSSPSTPIPVVSTGGCDVAYVAEVSQVASPPVTSSTPVEPCGRDGSIPRYPAGVSQVGIVSGQIVFNY